MNADEATLGHKRLDHLTSAAEQLAATAPDLARHLRIQALKISSQTQTQLPVSFHRSVCTGCGSGFEGASKKKVWRRHFLLDALRCKGGKMSTVKHVFASHWFRFSSDAERRKKVTGFYTPVLICDHCSLHTIMDIDSFNKPPSTRKQTQPVCAPGPMTAQKQPTGANKGLQRLLQQKAKKAQKQNSSPGSSLSSFLMDLQKPK